MRREPGLKIYSDAETLYTAAADFFVELVQKTVKKTGRVFLAHYGGGSPQPIFNRF
jgi:6-phosphogluconolactonase/glucosamine-6-phosphate isomerase/deaminase